MTARKCPRDGKTCECLKLYNGQCFSNARMGLDYANSALTLPEKIAMGVENNMLLFREFVLNSPAHSKGSVVFDGHFFWEKMDDYTCLTTDRPIKMRRQWKWVWCEENMKALSKVPRVRQSAKP